MKLPANWMTTAQAWLTVLIGLPAALAQFSDALPHKVWLGIAVAAAVAKLVVGQQQKDAKS